MTLLPKPKLYATINSSCVGSLCKITHNVTATIDVVYRAPPFPVFGGLCLNTMKHTVCLKTSGLMNKACCSPHESISEHCKDCAMIFQLLHLQFTETTLQHFCETLNYFRTEPVI